MKKLICLIWLISISILFVPSYHETYVKAKTLDDIVAEKSFKYSVSPKVVAKIINCESSNNPNAINITDREESYGLVQINLKVWKNITKEQATDPDFAVDYLAKNLSKGKASMWTCSKLTS